MESGPVIIVAGATGAVGGQVVQHLSEAGRAVVALSRGSGGVQTEGCRGAAADLKSLPGVEVAVADMADTASLARVFEGRSIAGVLLLCANFEGQLDAEKALIELCATALVPYVVKISTWSCYIDEGLEIRYAQWHGEIEQALVASGLPFTSLRPCWFQQNLGRGANLPRLRDTGCFAHPSNTAPARMVDARDVGDVAAALLLLPDAGRAAHFGRYYNVCGPEAWSMSDIAALVARSGRQAESQVISLEEMVGVSLGAGDALDWHARSQLVGWRDCWSQGKFDKPSSPEVLELCPPRRTVQQWIEENMPELLQPAASPAPP